MAFDGLPNQTTDPGLDLSREQVVALFRDLETDALRRHTGLVGSDGAGNLKVLCGCESAFGYEEWGVHLRAIVVSARRQRPQRKR